MNVIILEHIVEVNEEMELLAGCIGAAFDVKPENVKPEIIIVGCGPQIGLSALHLYKLDKMHVEVLCMDRANTASFKATPELKIEKLVEHDHYFDPNINTGHKRLSSRPTKRKRR